MQDAVGLFLFFTLLPAATLLTCEICNGDINCHGDRKLCPEDQKACSISLMSGFRGSKRFWSVSKKCTSFFACKSLPVHVALGVGTSFKESTTCCRANNCIPAFPELPRSAQNPNGRFCPTCFSSTNVCPPKTVDCNGTDAYCLSFTLVEDLGGIAKETIVKGCTSRSSCHTFKHFNETIFPGSIIKNLDCTPAFVAGIEKPSLSSRFLLLGLLVMKLCC